MQFGKTALHQACSAQHLEMAIALMQGGASVDQEDRVRLLYIHGQCVTQNCVMFRLFDNMYRSKECLISLPCKCKKTE